MENINFDENSPKEQSNHKKRRNQLIWAGIGLIIIILAIIGWQYLRYVQSF